LFLAFHPLSYSHLDVPLCWYSSRACRRYLRHQSSPGALLRHRRYLHLGGFLSRHPRLDVRLTVP
jgi:hypothetical protein